MKNKYLIIFVASFFSFFLSTASAIELQKNGNLLCTPSTGYICNSLGCHSINPKIWFIIRKNLYKRCDKKGCDLHDTTTTTSGIYAVLLINKNSLFKINLTNNQFLDIATLGANAYMYFGTCLKDKD